MLFRIECLTEATDETSVCRVRIVDADNLAAAEQLAWADAVGAWDAHKPAGFQIRDIQQGGQIVTAETFTD